MYSAWGKVEEGTVNGGSEPNMMYGRPAPASASSVVGTVDL
jgi:hypothetical protein